MPLHVVKGGADVGFVAAIGGENNTTCVNARMEPY